jgi:molecular chaperone IbpA
MKHIVGADKILENFNKAQQMFANTVAANYPPYNIVKVDENKYVIEMAVAGFGKQNLDIEIQDKVLTIKGGVSVDESNPANYIFKGIADRAFTRKFTLADTVEIKDAELINGMLKVWLENMIPEEKKVRKVDIKDTDKKSNSKLLTE